MVFPAFSFSAAPFFGGDRMSVIIGLKNVFGLSKIWKYLKGPTFSSKEFPKNYFACYSIIHFVVFSSCFCFSISPKCLVNEFSLSFFPQKHLILHTKFWEVIFVQVLQKYSLHSPYYTQLTYRMRSKERNMASTLRDYYLKQSFLRRSSLPRTVELDIGIWKLRNFPACREKTKVVETLNLIHRASWSFYFVRKVDSQ